MEKGSSVIRMMILLVAAAFSMSILWSLPTAFAKEPIRIGVTTDFSGITASFGLIETPAVKMAVEEVNKAGGINGRPIELFVLDNGSDPAKLLANLKLLKEKNRCVAMVQGVTSGLGIAAKKWAEENHITIISPDPGTDRLWQKEGKAWWFRTQYPLVYTTMVALDRIRNLGYKKVAYQGSTLVWGVDQRDSVRNEVSKYGIQVVGEVLCEPKSKDLTIQATKLRNTGAEAVLSGEYDAETGVFARALSTIGWKPFVIHLAASQLFNTLQNYPQELFEGWEVSQLIDVTKPAVKEVWDKYAAFTGKRYDDEKPPRAWDAIQILIEAIRLSGNPDDPEAIRDGFYKIKNFPIAIGRKDTTGSFTTGRNHLLTDKDLVMYVVKSGKLVPIQ